MDVSTDLARLFQLSDHRAAYDQFYYAILQYRGLAQRALGRADTALSKGDLLLAEHFIDSATRYTRQYVDAQSGASAAAMRDVDRAYAQAKAIYEGSKLALRVLTPHSPGAVALLDAGEFVADFTVRTTDSGAEQAFKLAAVDTVTRIFLELVPIPDLGDKSVVDALEDATAHALSDTGLEEVLRRRLADPGVRQIVDEAIPRLVGEVAPAQLRDRLEVAVGRTLDSFTGAGTSAGTSTSGGTGLPRETTSSMSGATPPASVSAEMQAIVGILAGQTGVHRVNSLGALVRAGRIPSGFNTAEFNAVAEGMGAYRSSAIRVLADLFPAGLSAPDVLVILGELDGVKRQNALYDLVRAKRIRTLSNAEIATITSTMGSYSESAARVLSAPRR